VSERALRLFAALELPPEAVAALEALAVDPEVWRRVPAESLHITLAFLGATDPAHVPALDAALAAGVGERAAPRLGFAGALLLLPPRRARVLAAAVADPDGSLAALQAEVAAGLAATGAYEPEHRRFRPHVTVARLRARARAPRAVATALDPLVFAGTAVTLFSSRTSPHGARYDALTRIPLQTGRTDD
jgi:2'-5' RNA ligase